MSDSNQAYSVMETLLGQRERLVRELDAIDGAISALGFSLPQATVTQKPDAKMPNYSGMPAPSRVFQVLENSGKAMLAREILQVLEEADAAPGGENKQTAVVNALNERKRKHDDVVHVGIGKWDIKSRYTPEELEQVAKLTDGANARDKVDHQKRMVSGIQKRMASGKHYGKPPKVMPEQWDLAVQIASEGKPVWTKVLDSINELSPVGVQPLSYSTVMMYKKQWLSGQGYPEKWSKYIEEHGRPRPSPNSVRAVK